MFFVVLPLNLQLSAASLIRQVSSQHTCLHYMESQTWPLLLKVHGWSPSQPYFRISGPAYMIGVRDILVKHYRGHGIFVGTINGIKL